MIRSIVASIRGVDMAVLKLNIEDETLYEAERILQSIGMSSEIAVNIFLRRIVLEKGLPLTMVASETSQAASRFSEESNVGFDFSEAHVVRSNHKITHEMVEAVWLGFLRYLEGSAEIGRLSTEVAEKTGMNRGSAVIYFNILANLEKGEANTRTMKMEDLEYYMGKIKSELGEHKFQEALKSLRRSVPYWKEKLAGSFGDRVEAYCRKYPE